jgi:hypothetical protein
MRLNPKTLLWFIAFSFLCCLLFLCLNFGCGLPRCAFSRLFKFAVNPGGLPDLTAAAVLFGQANWQRLLRARWATVE